MWGFSSVQHRAYCHLPSFLPLKLYSLHVKNQEIEDKESCNSFNDSHFCLAHNALACGQWPDLWVIHECLSAILLFYCSDSAGPLSSGKWCIKQIAFQKWYKCSFPLVAWFWKWNIWTLAIHERKRLLKKTKQEYVFFYYSYLLPNFCFPSTLGFAVTARPVNQLCAQTHEHFTQGTAWSGG